MQEQSSGAAQAQQLQQLQQLQQWADQYRNQQSGMQVSQGQVRSLAESGVELILVEQLQSHLQQLLQQQSEVYRSADLIAHVLA
eukprot:657146-Hanusia_phi.AAC.3